MGLREVNARELRNESPYLPVLEEKVEKLHGLSRFSGGIVTIPLKNIIGTVTGGRASAFAANFMPVLSPSSEFAIKWTKLHDSVVQEGVNQPVKALEYLNYYYLVEGNKRVSVSKYLEAENIECEVTQVMPPPEADDLEVRLYREFLHLMRDSGLRNLWFSEEGSVERLYQLMGKKQGVRWTDEETADFKAAYYRFRRAYKVMVGENLTITTGDAFLRYLEVFRYEGIEQKTERDFREQINQLYDEFYQKNEKQGVKLIMGPSEESQNASLLNALFAPSSLKAAFLYSRSPEVSGWMYWHELGRLSLQEEMGDRVETTACLCEDPKQYEEEIERLIEEGYRLIFATSPQMLEACIRPSVVHPECKIINCSLLASYHNVRSYYLRMYEVKLLLGMLAGAAADNNKIGYIADYPIFGTPASINAFALGARMVNPRAKVFLAWSSRADFCPEKPFDDPEIWVISNRDVSAPSHSAQDHGLYDMRNGKIENLAAPILNWGQIYIALTRSLLNGKWEADQSGARAIDYWWGMSANAIDLAVTRKMDAPIRRLVEAMHESIRDDDFRPFEGVLVDQDGVERCGEGESLSPAEILTMDYLLENVVGEIPTLDLLRPEAKSLVQLQGVRETDQIHTADFRWSGEGRG